MTTDSLFFDPDPEPPGDRLTGAPLAERMRPATLDEIVGQEHLVGEGRPLREAVERGVLPSIILWGPPGTGKTTLARLLARRMDCRFVAFSAVLAGIKDIKQVMAEAEQARRRQQRQTLLFVDEIHRFNKAQQDAFLPRVEAGDIVLVGATTENPSFEVNAALLSRARVFVLKPLEPAHLTSLLSRALHDTERGLGQEGVEADDAALEAIARYANGDARVALNLLELAVGLVVARPDDGAPSVSPTDVEPKRLTRERLADLIARRSLLYDKGGEEHFNLISALHKSLRNSDANAAVYWLGRMLESGEDPLYVARRMVRFASEDVGNADPQALVIALAAKDAAHFLGMPEANTALAQAAIYLATAPKSNAVYRAYGAAAEDATRDVAEPVPLHLRNAPTGLMRELDYGKGYQYAHDAPEGVTSMDCLPPALHGRQYYRPTERGFERELRRRLDYWTRVRESGSGADAHEDSPNDTATRTGGEEEER